jgi:hypothetical protein
MMLAQLVVLRRGIFRKNKCRNCLSEVAPIKMVVAVFTNPS